MRCYPLASLLDPHAGAGVVSVFIAALLAWPCRSHWTIKDRDADIFSELREDTMQAQTASVRASVHQPWRPSLVRSEPANSDAASTTPQVLDQARQSVEALVHPHRLDAAGTQQLQQQQQQANNSHSLAAILAVGALNGSIVQSGEPEEEPPPNKTGLYMAIGSCVLLLLGSVAGGAFWWVSSKRKGEQQGSGATQVAKSKTVAGARGRGTGRGRGGGRVTSKAKAQSQPAAPPLTRVPSNQKGPLTRVPSNQKGPLTRVPSNQRRQEKEKVSTDLQARAAIKVQALFRGWKARRHLAVAATQCGPRPLLPNQKLCLLIECVSGSSMPEVNTFGGCDPFVEFRSVHGDPMKKSRGNVDEPGRPERTVQTQAKSGDLEPVWKEKLELRNVANKADAYLQIILWDQNMTGNMVIGHSAMTIQEALVGLTFDVQAKKKETYSHTAKFMGLLEEGKPKKLPKTSVKCNFSYLEMVQFSIQISKATRVPKVDTFGTCDAFMEVRIVKHDVKKREFEQYPDPDGCIWSAKTEVVNNDIDPKWNASFKPVVPAYHGLQMQLILCDSNAPLPDLQICHAVIDLSDIIAGKPGEDPTQHKLKFSKLPQVAPAADFKKTQLTMTLGFEQVFVGSSKSDD